MRDKVRFFSHRHFERSRLPPGVTIQCCLRVGNSDYQMSYMIEADRMDRKRTFRFLLSRFRYVKAMLLDRVWNGEHTFVIAGDFRQAHTWAVKWEVRNLVYVHSLDQLRGGPSGTKIHLVGNFYDRREWWEMRDACLSRGYVLVDGENPQRILKC